MTYDTIRLEERGDVAWLVLNRPERLNAMNQTMLGEINAALDAVEADDRLRAVVVTGAGSAFSSGFDLKEQMEKRPQGIGQWRGLLRKDFDTVMRFWHFPKPTIAAVNGHCLAGAFELALACDMTIAADTAVFGEPELKFGAGIVVMLLPWIAGPKLAKEIIMTGADRITAEKAERIGIVNRIVPADTLERTALTLARHVAAVDPTLMRQTKHALNRTFAIMGMGEALEAALDIDLHIEGEGCPDKIQFMEIARREGLRAALAWRDARFPPENGVEEGT
ncbi:enoyl-CoA hydratase/isomerase family protein [Azospirillum doebereinerae]|uniref:Enoyl-CoA hydratase/isomerase family protein n=1 Tax=Azospirillum doebereinerae TaxID=92933 RepID=A0A433IZ68_9PROT|nr:enoyl-CoA hydratase/isomerase family protein [Azospirillum doebereinerae]RUQ59828.1 enoyl-CoA hydratase/isomerase family protein [Azospirillum doebereinerae]